MSVILKKQALKDYDKAPYYIKEAFDLWIDFMGVHQDNLFLRMKRYKDEALKGKLKGLRSVRLNKQWRVIFEENSQTIVTIERITPHEYRH
jgi:proteic killer suppression protein